MHELINFTGGRIGYNNDFQSLQRQDNIIKNYLLKGFDDGFVVSGCNVVDTDDITAGLVHLNGIMIEFEGATNVTFPCYIYQLADEEFSSRLYTIDNINKNALKKTRAGVTNNLVDVGVNDYITVEADGTRRDFQDVLIDLFAGSTDFSSKANKAVPAWSDLLLSNNWQAYPFGGTEKQKTPQFRKNDLGQVQIRGAVSTGDPATATSWVFATLPVGYRPTKELSFVVSGTGNFDGPFFKSLMIRTNGNLEFDPGDSFSPGANVYHIKLDIPPFYID